MRRSLIEAQRISSLLIVYVLHSSGTEIRCQVAIISSVARMSS